MTGAGEAVSGSRTAAGPMSERLFQSAFEHAAQFMALLSPAGVVLEVNRYALDLAGVERGDVVGVPFARAAWWRALAPEQQARLGEAVGAAAAGESSSDTLDTTAAEGRPATIEFSVRPLRDERGVVAWLIVEGRDVTALMRTEQRLRVSEATFKGMVDIASDAIISIDAGQSIVQYNQGAERIFGWTAAEAVGQPLGVLIPERYREIHTRHVENFGRSEVASRRMGERQEIAGLRRNGEEFPADASISKIDVGGQRLYTVVLRDITSRKRRERLQRFLAEAGARLARSLDVATTLRTIADLAVESFADYCVLLERKQDGSLWRVQTAHGDRVKQGIPEALRSYRIEPDWPHPAQQVLRSGGSVLIRDPAAIFPRAPDQDEEHYRLLESLGVRSAILAPLGAPEETHGVLAFFSTSAQHPYDEEDCAIADELAVRASLALRNARLYETARNAIQARDDVLAVVSHDLGNPLAAIRIGAGLLLRTLAPKEGGTGGWQHVEQIRHSVSQMERLINDLLDVKRIEAGHLSLEWERVSPAGMIADIIDRFEPIAAEKGILLSSAAPPSVASVRADRHRIVQVFSNLIGNAIKFTPAGGRIDLRAEQQGDEVIFAVADTGPGIATEDVAHVFDRFWQAHRRQREGIGLGLAIAHGIIQAHGGRIWVETMPGRGTTFFVALEKASAALDRELTERRAVED